jgi:hypothetical protein
VIDAQRRGTSIYYSIAPAAADRLRALAGELLGQAQVIPVAALGRPGLRATPATPQA